MKEEKSIKPAPYGPTDALETEAVVIFESLIDHEIVKADIKKRDKFPNIDGYLELLDEKRIPIGKTETQVKRLSKANIDPPKIRCETSFLSYCEESILPVILIGVDAINRRSYWLHIDENFTAQLRTRAGQKSKTVHFPKGNIIDGQNTGYIQAWKAIASILFWIFC